METLKNQRDGLQAKARIQEDGIICVRKNCSSLQNDIQQLKSTVTTFVKEASSWFPHVELLYSFHSSCAMPSISWVVLSVVFLRS